MPAEPIQVLLQVAQILEDLEVPYLTGGSLASSIYGIPRATQDIDLVIALSHAKVNDFVKAMQPDFYIDSNAVLQAVHRRTSFNAIHFKTVQKIDFFIQGQSDHAGEEMKRRLKIAVDEASEHQIFIASPEDIILQKLLWYKMGLRISERQWNDVLGVMKIQGNRLDREYLALWAEKLAVADLLEDAFRNAV
jgi:hypothetical protein